MTGWGAFKVCNPRTGDTPQFRTRRKNPLFQFIQISKWQANPDAAEAHERTQGAHVLALEGR